MEADEGFWVRFVVVTGLLVGGVSVAGVFLGMGGAAGGRRKKGGLVRGDGSRRDSGVGGNEWARGGVGGAAGAGNGNGNGKGGGMRDG